MTAESGTSLHKFAQARVFLFQCSRLLQLHCIYQQLLLERVFSFTNAVCVASLSSAQTGQGVGSIHRRLHRVYQHG